MTKKIYTVYAGAIGEKYEFSSIILDMDNSFITDADIDHMERKIMDETNYIYDTVIILNWKEIE